jgi:hypothetical protein
LHVNVESFVFKCHLYLISTYFKVSMESK